MNARNLSAKMIQDGINRGNYELTGILETGEVVIAIVNDIEQKIKKEKVDKCATNEERLEIIKKLMSIKGRPAKELLQVYKQNNKDKFSNRCKKNNLRFR